MKTVMKKNFGEIQAPKINRSVFNRSHGLKTTFDAGQLIPIYVDEALPGDTFNMSMSHFARLATPIKPIMDNLHLDTFFFAVPVRILFDNWKKLNGEQENPGDSTDYSAPVVTTPVGGHLVGSLADYFGIPTEIDDLDPCAFHFNAYNLIYNEFFRDENLINARPVNKGAGPHADTDYTIQKRGKRHDYFTSCLPWPQKGTEVTLPLGTTAPVEGIGAFDTTYPGTSGAAYETGGSGTVTYAKYKDIESSVSSRSIWIEEDPNNAGYPGIYANLEDATAASINDLREAFQIQSIYEKDARGGTRYTEIMNAHFGVVSPDARQQRPEYLGGSSSRITINPVSQTTSTDATTPQGNLAGFGVSAGSAKFTKSFTEHMVLIGLASVRADLSYQQGLDRMWSRSTRFDWALPSLAHLGEQAVLNKEIYAQGTAADDDVFGYQERYAEYRHKNSMITGQFRSTYSTPLDMWHLAEEYSTLPTLGQTWIEDNPPVSRVVAVSTEPEILFDSYYNLTCVRPLPKYGTPSTLGRF